MKLNLLSLLLVALSFSSIQAQIESVGIIGSATEKGWAEDTPMTRVDENNWTIEITLTNGEVKFRANGSWDINWGDLAFPRGIGTQNGPNIPVFAGTYKVSFNSTTGEYFFDVESDISIIGSAAFGWDTDVKMYPVEGSEVDYYLEIELNQGDLKFRQDQDWAVNWGGSDFPEGIATLNGPNIPIPKAGNYAIEFNKETGAYRFTEIVAFESIGIIGSATPGGWDEETPLRKDADGPLWRAVLELTDGEAKFRANNSWDINWGGTDFPIGVGELNGPNIPVTAGTYLVIFEPESGEYNFLTVQEYDQVSIIGSATPGGWDNDTPMEKDPEDGSVWHLRIDLVEGFMKFRANNDWAVNWGDDQFPSGIGYQDGPDIPVPSDGEYIITFNTTTGEYNFEEIIEYDAVSLVGASGPFGAWPSPDDMGAKDFFLDKSPENPQIWTGKNIELTDYDATNDGGIKFRADTSWTVNWGAEEFPEGVGRQDGPNIRPTAGTWDVVFNSETGEYVFTLSSSTIDILSSDLIKLFPNPTSQWLNIELGDQGLFGSAQVKIFDASGRVTFNDQISLSHTTRINVSSLMSGNYTVNISNDKLMISKNFVISK